MADTFTTSNRFALQATGDNPSTWGARLNTRVFDMVDESLDGVTTLDITATTAYTLTTASGTTDQARKRVLVISGTATANATVTVPALNKMYVVGCTYTGAYTVTIKTAGDAGVVLKAGDGAVIYVTPSGVFDVFHKSDMLQASNNLSDLTDKVAARAALGLGNPTVNTFTNNGSTTVRTLTQDPGTVNAMIVVFDGVVQQPDIDYTLSGTTLTYTSAPANGTKEVIFIGNQSLPAGVTSDGSVTLAKLASSVYATNAEATAGTDNTKVMTPLRVKEAIFTPLLILQDQKASGTAGGTFTAGAWQTRTLNTTVTDTIGSTLTSNQFTLPAGTYYFEAICPTLNTNSSQARLQNITDATTTLLGINCVTGTTAGGFGFVNGQFTITGTKTFELQNRCSITRATDGFGYACGWGTEVYAEVRVWKVD